jgi:hypothetical protein
MSVYFGFNNVSQFSIGENKIFKTDTQFSARTVTLTFNDGSEFSFYVYGDITGIPVTVQERETNCVQLDRRVSRVAPPNTRI